MNHERHARAEQLIAQERVEGISQAEHSWLSAHLQECAQCAEEARQTEHALRSMRTAAFPLPSGLASRTQFRVHLRAMELREREPKRRTMWLACAVSWGFGIASAPYVWSLFQWVGQRAGLPKLVWEVGWLVVDDSRSLCRGRPANGNFAEGRASRLDWPRKLTAASGERENECPTTSNA